MTDPARMAVAMGRAMPDRPTRRSHRRAGEGRPTVPRGYLSVLAVPAAAKVNTSKRPARNGAYLTSERSADAAVMVNALASPVRASVQEKRR